MALLLKFLHFFLDMIEKVCEVCGMKAPKLFFCQRHRIFECFNCRAEESRNYLSRHYAFCEVCNSFVVMIREDVMKGIGTYFCPRCKEYRVKIANP